MFGKVFLAVILASATGATALTLGLDPIEMNKEPIEMAKESTEDVAFSSVQRIDLVRTMQRYTFENYISDYEKEYVKDSPQYKKRAAIFYRKKAETIRLAGLPKLTWIPAMNKFLDQTKPEMKAMMGYKRTDAKHGFNFAARKPAEVVPSRWKAPETVDWSVKLNVSKQFDRDQGSCGSCWAVATVTALEMATELKFGTAVPLSIQELVSCVPNPRKCGGAGGCEGATAELALDYLAQDDVRGLSMDSSYEYSSMWGDSGECDKTKATFANKVVTVDGYIGVQTNNLEATMYALVTHGPLVVAVDAGTWSFYGGGIFNSCKKDATLNHAVVLIGYGKDGSRGWWNIKNSWGSDWGDAGHIKLSRSTNKGATFCGMDYKPQEGSACEGEDDPVKVCGMCGILYEPVATKINTFKKPAGLNLQKIINGFKNKKRSYAKKLQ